MVTTSPAPFSSKSKTVNMDLNTIFGDAASQFKGLNPSEPGNWPLLPKIAIWLAVGIAVVVVSWFLMLSSASDDLDAERAKEPVLKDSYHAKLAQAINLPELRKQRLQVLEYVTQLEKQLPGKAEMDALLSDVNQAGLGRGLQFELFRPGQIAVKDYYAELPISIRVSGRYHDIGSFASDIANLSRIVTLHNIVITPVGAPGGLLAMDATARTYRYLDPTEVADQRRASGKPPGNVPRNGAKP